MNARSDPDRLIHTFILEGEEELQDQVYDAVRAQIERKRQRVVIGPWRTPIMNRIVGIGLAAAAVVAAIVIGSQLLGSPGSNIGGPDSEPTPTAEPTATLAPTQSPSAWTGTPEGQFVVTSTNDPVQVTVNIASSGWFPLREFDALSKGDDGLDSPESVGAALLAWAWPAETGFDVYGDPCQWSTTIPETPATTPDEMAAAFAAQASTDATAPVDVTVGGYTGKAITLNVPMSFDLPNATREEKFADCDNDIFGFYGLEGGIEPERNAQGAGQIDELWILDVDGSIVILDAAYGPGDTRRPRRGDAGHGPIGDVRVAVTDRALPTEKGHNRMMTARAKVVRQSPPAPATGKPSVETWYYAGISSAQPGRRRRPMPALTTQPRVRLIGFALLMAAVVLGSLAFTRLTAVHADHGLPHGTILARGAFADATDVQFRTRIAGKMSVMNVKNSDDVIVQNVTIAPGATTGWHSHHGPVVVVVAAGTMTLYQGDDPGCMPHVYDAGEVFIDPGQGNVHIARNEGAAGVQLLATYFDVPPGAGPAIAHPNPGHCTGF